MSFHPECSRLSPSKKEIWPIAATRAMAIPPARPSAVRSGAGYGGVKFARPTDPRLNSDKTNPMVEPIAPPGGCCGHRRKLCRLLPDEAQGLHEAKYAAAVGKPIPLK